MQATERCLASPSLSNNLGELRWPSAYDTPFRGQTSSSLLSKCTCTISSLSPFTGTSLLCWLYSDGTTIYKPKTRIEAFLSFLGYCSNMSAQDGALSGRVIHSHLTINRFFLKITCTLYIRRWTLSFLFPCTSIAHFFPPWSAVMMTACSNSLYLAQYFGNIISH